MHHVVSRRVVVIMNDGGHRSDHLCTVCLSVVVGGGVWSG